MWAKGNRESNKGEWLKIDTGWFSGADIIVSNPILIVLITVGYQGARGTKQRCSRSGKLSAFKGS
jgi:hypothetical protein